MISWVFQIYNFFQQHSSRFPLIISFFDEKLKGSFRLSKRITKPIKSEINPLRLKLRY